MNGLVIGMAMLVGSAGVPPASEPAREAAAPSVFTFELPDRAGPVRERRAPRSAPSARRKVSTVERIIAVAAGVSVGFVAGGVIGGKITENRDNPDDDISPLKGIMIGAPIGAVAGGLIAWGSTK